MTILLITGDSASPSAVPGKILLDRRQSPTRTTASAPSLREAPL